MPESWIASRINAAQLHDAWSKSARLRELVERHTEALFGHALQSVGCNALHSVEARFCRWLLTCHDRISTDTIALTQEFLADMLGVQRTTVTAVARSLQEKGAIQYRRGVLAIIAFFLVRGGIAALKATNLAPDRTARSLSRDAALAREQMP